AMNYSQKKYTRVLQDSQLILAQLEGKDDSYARVSSFLWRHLGLAARKLDDMALFHDAIQRSYIEIRRIRSANHVDALKVRKLLNIDAIDPDTFPHAEELGVSLRGRGKLTLSADGTVVLQEYLDGRALWIGRKLQSFVKSNETSALGHLNLGLYHALMGEITPAETAISTARQLAQSNPTAALPADAPWFDLYLALAYVWAREWRPQQATPPLDRLSARDDLTDTQRRLVSAMRMQVAYVLDQFDTSRRIYRADWLAYDPRSDSSHWGVILALGLLPVAFDLSRDIGDDLRPKVIETVRAAGSPKLAAAMLPVILGGSDPGYSFVERNFQSLAYHVQALSRMLPPEHELNAIAKLTYAYGLWNRGQLDEALNLFTQAIRAYKSSPWHRPDAVGFLEVLQAQIYGQKGDEDLARAIIAQTYAAMDPDSYRPTYWREIFTAHVFRLISAGEVEQALAVSQSVVDRPDLAARLSPFDLANFYVTHASALQFNYRFDDAISWLDRARAAIPSADYKAGGPLMFVLEARAYTSFDMGDMEGAYRAMTSANDIYFRAVEEAAARGSADSPRNPDREKTLVMDQAHFAWALAQQLQAAEGAQ
ncbi:MAG: hypothetical protein OIF47_17760, partial [Marinibacterium sp.]|nr:hypothetical protein [Marinibacterium sp.]